MYKQVFEGYHGGSAYKVSADELLHTVGRDYAYGLPNVADENKN